MIELAIPIKVDSKEPIYQQIYKYIKNEIQSGRLQFGDKLPSTRALSEHLQISRSTVDFAYEQLLSEGYIESIPYKGHFVCEITGIFESIPEPKKAGKKPEEQIEKEHYDFDFSPNGIDVSLMPFDTWKKLSKNALLDGEHDIFHLGDAKGDFSLRDSICRYLYGSRGVNTTPSNIIVGAGNDYLLMLLQKILGPDLKVAVENPAYTRAANIFAASGNEILPISLDEDGMDVLKLKNSQADVAYITPSRQFPTGIVMPVSRRTELLLWAKEGNRFIIEDDYDSEFRYKGKPIPSLQSMDKNNSVIYLGTFSKSITPAIRISYMVLPDSLLEIYEEKLSFISSTVSRIDQSVITSFIDGGHFERHLNKMRKVYKGKHDLLLECLKPFRNSFTISGEHGGLHVVLTDQKGRSEEELILLAKKQGCKIYSMKNCYIGKTPQTEKASFLLGYATLTETQIRDGLEALKVLI